MKETCCRCDGVLPVVPGLSQHDVRASQSSSYVSHVCSDPDSTFHQSITFITGYASAVTRAQRVWNDDSLWDLPEDPTIECENCGEFVHEVVQYYGDWVCSECEINAINTDAIAGDT